MSSSSSFCSPIATPRDSHGMMDHQFHLNFSSALALDKTKLVEPETKEEKDDTQRSSASSKLSVEGMDREELRSYFLGNVPDQSAELSTVEHAGKVFFGDKEAMGLYGLSPREWFGRGIRILHRTVIECTIDEHARPLMKDILREVPQVEGAVVIDLFAGSGNTLFHAGDVFKATELIGVEKNDAVFRASHANFKAMVPGGLIVHGSWEQHLPLWMKLHSPSMVFIISPPWGQGFSFERGLDISKTSPSVPDILKTISRQVIAVHQQVSVLALSPRQSEVYAIIQIHEKCDEAALAHTLNSSKWIEVFRCLSSTSDPGSNIGFVVAKLAMNDTAAGDKRQIDLTAA